MNTSKALLVLIFCFLPIVVSAQQPRDKDPFEGLFPQHWQQSGDREELISDPGGPVVATFSGRVSTVGDTWLVVRAGPMKAVVTNLQRVTVAKGTLIKPGTTIGTAQSGRRAAISVCRNYADRLCETAPSDWPQAKLGTLAEFIALREFAGCDQVVFYSIREPSPSNTPENARMFSGVWVGKLEWGNCTALIVEEIRQNGTATVVYMAGEWQSFKANNARLTASITGNKLSWKGNAGVTFDYTMTNPTQLDMIRVGSGSDVRARLFKQQ